MKKEFELLMNICINRIKSGKSIKEISRKLDISDSDPRFRNIMRILIDNKILILNEKIFQAQSFTINLKKLTDYIKNNSDDFKLCEDFIVKTNPFANV